MGARVKGRGTKRWTDKLAERHLFGGVERLILLLSKYVFLVPSGIERFLSGSVRSVFRVDTVLCALVKQCFVPLTSRLSGDTLRCARR